MFSKALIASCALCGRDAVTLGIAGCRLSSWWPFLALLQGVQLHCLRERYHPSVVPRLCCPGLPKVIFRSQAESSPPHHPPLLPVVVVERQPDLTAQYERPFLDVHRSAGRQYLPAGSPSVLSGPKQYIQCVDFRQRHAGSEEHTGSRYAGDKGVPVHLTGVRL